MLFGIPQALVLARFHVNKRVNRDNSLSDECDERKLHEKDTKRKTLVEQMMCWPNWLSCPSGPGHVIHLLRLVLTTASLHVSLREGRLDQTHYTMI